KQYQKLFEMERVKLTFSREALRSIAHEAMRRKAGARGLRAIMENAMLDIQYDVPYRDSIKECKITEGVILRGEEPTLLFEKDRQDGRSWQGSDDRSGAYGDERYDWSVPDDDEEGWQPSDGDDSGYAAARGPSYDDFRNDAELSWNGEWIQTPEYGTVWRPRRVRDDWQPYVYGRWVWTEAGWAWASDEPFGWAVYHYGRWAWSPAAGWMWVPGRIWAPAWGTWRWTDGYAAWWPIRP